MTIKEFINKYEIVIDLICLVVISFVFIPIRRDLIRITLFSNIKLIVLHIIIGFVFVFVYYLMTKHKMNFAFWVLRIAYVGLVVISIPLWINYRFSSSEEFFIKANVLKIDIDKDKNETAIVVRFEGDKKKYLKLSNNRINCNLRDRQDILLKTRNGFFNYPIVNGISCSLE